MINNEFYQMDPNAYQDEQMKLDNLVFNVIGPKIGKELGINKKRFKERVYDTRIRKELKSPANYDTIKKRINFASEKVKSRNIGKYIGAEIGHALGELLEDYNPLDDFSEYYDRLGQHAAKKATEGSKYDFEMDDILKKVDNIYKIAKTAKLTLNKIDEMSRISENHCVSKEEIGVIEKLWNNLENYFTEREFDEKHMEPYLIADVILEKFSLKDAFQEQYKVDKIIEDNPEINKKIHEIKDKFSLIKEIKENIRIYSSSAKTNLEIAKMFLN